MTTRRTGPSTLDFRRQEAHRQLTEIDAFRLKEAGAAITFETAHLLDPILRERLAPSRSFTRKVWHGTAHTDDDL